MAAIGGGGGVVGDLWSLGRLGPGGGKATGIMDGWVGAEQVEEEVALVAKMVGDIKTTVVVACDQHVRAADMMTEGAHDILASHKDAINKLAAKAERAEKMLDRLRAVQEEQDGVREAVRFHTHAQREDHIEAARAKCADIDARFDAAVKQLKGR